MRNDTSMMHLILSCQYTNSNVYACSFLKKGISCMQTYNIVDLKASKGFVKCVKS